MGTEARGCIWGPSLGAESRICKAFKVVKMGHVQRLLQTGDGSGRQFGKPPFSHQSQPGGISPPQPPGWRNQHRSPRAGSSVMLEITEINCPEMD